MRRSVMNAAEDRIHVARRALVKEKVARKRSVGGKVNELQETLFQHGEQLICNGAAARFRMNIKTIHFHDAMLDGEPVDSVRIKGFVINGYWVQIT